MMSDIVLDVRYYIMKIIVLYRNYLLQLLNCTDHCHRSSKLVPLHSTE